jgi:hypothetical protein
LRLTVNEYSEDGSCSDLMPPALLREFGLVEELRRRGAIAFPEQG